MRYFAELSYCGTQYHGWQIQPNALSVQEVIEQAFSVILRGRISLTGAGRTDTGVHAKKFVAHFDLPRLTIDPIDFVYKLNSFLPPDISIHDIYEVKDDVHARFSAISRTYEYHMHIHKDPFLVDFSHRLYSMPDIQLMNEAAKILFEYSDFTSFCKVHTDNHTNICKLMRAEFVLTKNQLVFTVQADRFLRNMVRSVTGTILDLGYEKISISDFRQIIESRDRQNAGVSMPAKGLYLVDIAYPEDIFPNC